MNSYFQAWQDFWRLRRNMMILAGVWFLAITVAMFLHPIFPTINIYAPISIVMMMSIPWIVSVVNLENRIALWPCPRCEKPFCGGRAALREARSWSLSPAQCSNCGLHKNAEASAQ
jgi:hypothetical protein